MPAPSSLLRSRSLSSSSSSRAILSLVLAGGLATLAAPACGDGRDGFTPEADGGSSSSSGGGSSSSSSGSIGGGSSSSGGTETDSGLGACAAETQAGKQLPLDIHIMLDASGSMMAPTGADGNGPTKWSEVKNALGGFIADPKSAGLGVGLGIFPIRNAAAPASCTSSAQCNVNGNDFGKCGLKVCSPGAVAGPLVPCDSPADCPGNAACRELGQCRAAGGFIILGDCVKDEPGYGCLIGSCKTVTTSSCWNDSCIVGDYDHARVPIGTLPGNASTLTTSIGQIPDPPETALTPTAAALEGGLAYAKQYKTTNPEHMVVVVLATDGFPTRCTPSDIPGVSAIAQTAANGNPAVKTFVIGVFSEDEKNAATTNLDAIATAGGTNKAFIVSTGANVTQQFQQALEAIRGQALPCEYAVPKPEGGVPDYDKVNVQYTANGKTELIGFKKNAAACDATGGWYYDIEPGAGTPGKIILCPTSCEAVKAPGASAKLDVLLGCKTVVK